MKTLTPQQQRVLDYISREIEERGYPPSVREICAALGFRSSSTAHRYLAALEEKAFLAELSARLHGLLGNLGELSPRAVFPLMGLQAEHMARTRTALVGEAAHVIPPIGAQGLNLGVELIDQGRQGQARAVRARLVQHQSQVLAHPVHGEAEVELALGRRLPAIVHLPALRGPLGHGLIGGVGVQSRDLSEVDRFGHMLDAFEYGAPPHGGVAPGIDRTVALLAGVGDIREVIAFPKTKTAADPMTGAPSPVDAAQLRDLHIAVTE